jgi:putative sugar O-methyltransferase
MAESSKLWEKLTSDVFQKIDKSFLENFRAPGQENKFVAWDPYERSTRYLKFLLYTIASKQTNEFFEAYRKIKMSNYGNPLSVSYSDCNINADYLAAVEEWQFLKSCGGFEGVSSVVEIGAGFGRTCHAILTLSPQIKEYSIVDLDPMLELSRQYLSQVAPEILDRVQFISSNDVDLQEQLRPDLVINIDSFQEMPSSIIEGYMNRIVRKANKFYCKNPVGKYLPEAVGMPQLGPEKLLDVFKLGRCTNVIDIFCEQELQSARDDFVNKYLPPPSYDNFNEIKPYKAMQTQVMDLFPYFHHVLYVRG